MRKYILSLSLALAGFCAMAQEPQDWTVVACPEAGQLVATLQELYGDDWTTIEYLKVSGPLNGNDFRLSNMKELKILDMGEATFADNVFPAGPSYYNKFQCPEIVIPASIEKIDYYAFANMPIQKITFGPGEVQLREIGSQAFYQCDQLREFDVSTVKSIGYCGFYCCRNFDPKSIQGLEMVGESSFNGSGITEVYEGFFAPTCTTIGKNAFAYCYSLKSAYIPDNITALEDKAFFYTNSLTDLRMSNRIESIGEECFYASAVKEVNIPATIKHLNPTAFEYMKGLEVLSCATLVPPAPLTDVYNEEGICMLKVPAVSKELYRNTPGWNKIRYIVALDSVPSILNIATPLSDEILSAEFISAIDGIDLCLTSDAQTPDRVGQFTVANSTLNLRNWESEFRYFPRYNKDYPYYVPTLVNSGTITADGVSVKMIIENKVWNFISLPFDAKMSEIEHEPDTYLAVRYYDGARRAENQSGWVDMPADGILEAGKAYIVYAYHPDNSHWPSVKFQAIDNAKKQGMFVTDDVTVPLQRNSSESPWLDSWNFIGNPYPAYTNITDISDDQGNPVTAPITVWGDNGYYYAYSPIDDEVVLLPFEGFFIQCPESMSGLKFQAANRMHYAEALDYRAPGFGYKAPAKTDASRQLFNFLLSDGTKADRARIVLNEQASLSYELGRDAAKITDMVEGSIIFVSADQQCAICERPLADGFATLGVKIAQAGSYTISLDGRFADGVKVLLTDNATGATTELTAADYAFTAAAGEDAERFTVQFSGEGLSGLAEAIMPSSDFITVTNVAGTRVFAGRKADFVAPASGIYIISDGTTARKIFVNK